MSRNLHKCLTDEDVVNFVLEELPAEIEEAIEQHLEGCVACSKRLGDFYDAQDTFPAEEWAARRAAFVDTLHQRVFAPTTFVRDDRWVYDHSKKCAVWVYDHSKELAVAALVVLSLGGLYRQHVMHRNERIAWQQERVQRDNDFLALRADFDNLGKKMSALQQQRPAPLATAAAGEQSKPPVPDPQPAGSTPATLLAAAAAGNAPQPPVPAPPPAGNDKQQGGGSSPENGQAAIASGRR